MRTSWPPAPTSPICAPSRGAARPLPRRASQPHGLRGDLVFPAPVSLGTRQLGEMELLRDFLRSRMEDAWPQASLQIIRPINKHCSFVAWKMLAARTFKEEVACLRPAASSCLPFRVHPTGPLPAALGPRDRSGPCAAVYKKGVIMLSA